MGIAYESNTNLAFDTQLFRDKGKEYKDVADELRDMAEKLDKLLTDLKDTGWTTPAGSAFHDLVNTNWADNIEKYASLLETLQTILEQSANEYDGLVTNYIQNTKV